VKRVHVSGWSVRAFESELTWWRALKFSPPTPCPRSAPPPVSVFPQHQSPRAVPPRSASDQAQNGGAAGTQIAGFNDVSGQWAPSSARRIASGEQPCP
jgi:hypothetical protein